MPRWVLLIFIFVLSVLTAVVVARRFYRDQAPTPLPTASGEYAAATREIMATPISVLAPAPRVSEAAETVFSIFREVDARMSEWKPTSPLSQVNAAAGRRPVEVPADLRTLIRRGIELGDRTGGAFDITWAALWGLWDFKAEVPRLPDPGEVAQRARLVDYRQVQVDDDAGTVYLPREGMMIGLGGIAKGYALDLAANALRQKGITSFLISAGGQMMAAGQRGTRPWRVGIRDPRGSADEYFAYVEVEDQSVATSGDYERYFILDGVRYHHILDPRTGLPARGVVSTTVISPDATLADALSTALLVMGAESGLALAQEFDRVEALLIDDRGGLHMTPGMQATLVIRHPPSLTPRQTPRSPSK